MRRQLVAQYLKSVGEMDADKLKPAASWDWVKGWKEEIRVNCTPGDKPDEWRERRNKPEVSQL